MHQGSSPLPGGPGASIGENAVKAQAAEEPQDGGAVRKMTLVDCVVLALRNNLDLQSTFLDRIKQRLQLKVDETMFQPRNFTLGLSSSREAPALTDYGDRKTGITNKTTVTGGTWTIPTGGSFTFGWDNTAIRQDVSKNVAYSGTWSVTFTQSLTAFIRGYGMEIGMAPLKLVKIEEESNIQRLKRAIIGNINDAINNYRNYLTAVRQLAIARQSLESAKSTYETNKALVQAGKTARSELVQSEYDIATQESSVESAVATLDSNRLTLVQFLNLPLNTQFEVEEEEASRVPLPDFERALSLAMEKQPEYLVAQNNFAKSELSFKVIASARSWDFSLTSGVTGPGATGDRIVDVWNRQAASGRAGWSTGLNLTIPFLAFQKQADYLKAKITLDQDRLNLRKTQIALEIDLKNKLRTVVANYRQWELMKQALVLAQKRYETELEKLAVGRTSNFQLLTFKNGLTTSQQSELSARIAYLGSLTTLDSTLGTTLDTWGITVKPGDETPPVPTEKPKPVANQPEG